MKGVLFEFEHLFSFVRKHKCNPVTGQPMSTSDILRLNMSKNDEGFWHCPVLFKVFNNSTHIVAIRPTGNVYSFEAVNELNLKPNSLIDLLTEAPFHRSDIITLQNVDDPQHVALRDVSNFQYLQVMRDDFAHSKSNDKIRNNPTAERVMKEFHEKNQANQTNSTSSSSSSSSSSNNNSSTSSEYVDDVNAILSLQPTTEDIYPGHMMTDQKTSSSLTSTSFDVHTNSKLRLATPAEIREARWRFMRQVIRSIHLFIYFNLHIYHLYMYTFQIHTLLTHTLSTDLCLMLILNVFIIIIIIINIFKINIKIGKKSYIQIQTNFGSLNFEIHCDRYFLFYFFFLFLLSYLLFFRI